MMLACFWLTAGVATGLVFWTVLRQRGGAGLPLAMLRAEQRTDEERRMFDRAFGGEGGHRRFMTLLAVMVVLAWPLALAGLVQGGKR